MDSLDTSYDDIRQEIAFLRGWGVVSTSWDARQVMALDQAMKNGQQRFFFEATQPGTQKVYVWSFLQSMCEIGTVATQIDYQLPDDFGSPDGSIYSADGTVSYGEVRWVNEGIIDQRRGVSPSDIGYPRLACIRSTRNRGAGNQRWTFSIWPAPDAAYFLRFKYNVLPDALTSTFQKAPGGAPHARTLKLACLAEAFRRLDNAASYEQDYQQSLAASISYDSRRSGDNLGYNGDPSSGDWGRRSQDLRPDVYHVTVEGVQY